MLNNKKTEEKLSQIETPSEKKRRLLRLVSDDQKKDDQYQQLRNKLMELEIFEDTLVIKSDEWWDIQNQYKDCNRELQQRYNELYDISFKRCKEGESV